MNIFTYFPVVKMSSISINVYSLHKIYMNNKRPEKYTVYPFSCDFCDALELCKHLMTAK